MPTCSGCDTWFSVGGYSSHMKQTRNPACTAIRDTQEIFGDLGDLETDISDTETVKQFGGDALGTYDDINFGDEEDDVGGDRYEGQDMDPEDEEDEEDEWGVGPGDDEDAENAAQEGGWEPPVHEGPGDEGMDEDEDQNENDNEVEREGGPEQNMQDVRLIDKGAQPFVVNYPDPRAGAPITDERRYLGWEHYQRELDGGDPWVSKLDWDFAQWAMLRGPGATALTELLKLDGVRGVILLKHRVHDETYFPPVASRRVRFIVQVCCRATQEDRQDFTEAP